MEGAGRMLWRGRVEWCGGADIIVWRRQLSCFRGPPPVLWSQQCYRLRLGSSSLLASPMLS